MIKNLKLIKEVVGDAIEAAQDNVGLSCVSITYSLQDDGQEFYTAWIDGVDPEIAWEFHSRYDDLIFFIQNYIAMQSKVSINKELIIRMA